MVSGEKVLLGYKMLGLGNKHSENHFNFYMMKNNQHTVECTINTKFQVYV